MIDEDSEEDRPTVDETPPPIGGNTSGTFVPIFADSDLKEI